MNKDDEIRLVFRPLASTTPWPSRVRMLLKVALRAFRLRCEKVEMLPAGRKGDLPREETK